MYRQTKLVDHELEKMEYLNKYIDNIGKKVLRTGRLIGVKRK